MRTTELINNGVSIEADAVLGLNARIQRFGGYATDEIASRPSHSTPRKGGSLKKSGRGCRIGAVLFVVGVRPPTRGGAKVKEPRS
jgi:hypothetical protein